MTSIKALFVLFFLILTVSCALAAEKKNNPEIKTVDNYIAVFDLEVTTGDKGIPRPLTDNVIHELSRSGKYEVIDRGNMNNILKEQKFQISGCVAQECKVEAGQLLGVGKIVSGSVGQVGKTYFITLQLINVKTGKIEISVAEQCKCELDELLDSTRKLSKKLLGEKVEESAAKVPEPVVVDRPAGARSSQSTAEEMARDGRFIAYSNGTVLDKQTNLMWAAKDNGSSINWADARSYCENYLGGGYTDWRMPTQNELAGLYDSNKRYKATQLIQLSACCPWASETRGSVAALFDFLSGGWLWDPRYFSYCYRALPVRSGK